HLGSNFGGSPDLELRHASKALELDQCGLSAHPAHESIERGCAESRWSVCGCFAWTRVLSPLASRHLQIATTLGGRRCRTPPATCRSRSTVSSLGPTRAARIHWANAGASSTVGISATSAPTTPKIGRAS